jgi:hypothetical protein
MSVKFSFFAKCKKVQFLTSSDSYWHCMFYYIKHDYMRLFSLISTQATCLIQDNFIICIWSEESGTLRLWVCLDPKIGMQNSEILHGFWAEKHNSELKSIVSLSFVRGKYCPIMV